MIIHSYNIEQLKLTFNECTTFHFPNDKLNNHNKSFIWHNTGARLYNVLNTPGVIVIPDHWADKPHAFLEYVIFNNFWKLMFYYTN